MVRQHQQLNGHISKQTSGDSKGRESGMLQSMGSQRVGSDFATEQQSFSIVKETRLKNMRYRMIIWQHVRKCLTGQYKVDKNVEGIQRGKITGDGPNQ